MSLLKDTTEKVELYFAYGSCMGDDILRTLQPIRRLGSGRVQGRELAFTRYSEGRQGGVADIVESPGATVEGVVYEIAEADLPNLDVREGVPTGFYRRIRVPVEMPGAKEPLMVWTYEVIEKSDRDIAPSQHYASLMLEAAQVYLSEEYSIQMKRKIDGLRQQVI